MKPLLTVKQVAERISLSIPHVYQLLANGSIEHYELGKGTTRSRRVSEEQLTAYIEKRNQSKEQAK